MVHGLDQSVRLLLPVCPLEDRQRMGFCIEDPLVQGYQIFVREE